MKRLIIILFLVISNCHAILSQDENFVVFFTDAITNGVPVYSNDTGTDRITIIQEYLEKENWHDVEILRKSNNRYKVRIIAINENDVTPIIGWVDKEQCGVWLRGKWTNPELSIVSLYRMPGQLYPFVKLTDKYANGFHKYVDTKSNAVPVLDYKLYKGKYWIKTVVIKDKRKIIGWTTNYCPNPYDSCT